MDNPAGPGGQTATQQLQSTNTGHSGANTGVTLIPGPINTPPPALLAGDGGVEAATPPDSTPEVDSDPQPPVADANSEPAPVDDTAPAETDPEPAPVTDTDTPADTGTQTPPPADTGTQTPPPADTPIVDDGVLTQAELDYFVDAAIARWSEAGLTEAQLDALEAMSFGVADMAGLHLGSFAPTQITLDADAAGRGWYLDGTPLDDAEFGTVFSATWMQTSPTGAPAGHYDLLTTIMHEMGHALGLGDSYASGDRGELMYGWLYTGERRLPGADDADGAVAGSITEEEFLGAPIDIGVLPAGKTVTIQWQATIDPQTNGLSSIRSTPARSRPPTRSASADTNTNTVTTTLDTLTLGGTIWNDNGAGGGIAGNGIKDGTEAGIAGVTLSLFVDANNDDVPDNLDAPLVTGVRRPTPAATIPFTGLAPGNYIVQRRPGQFRCRRQHLAGRHAGLAGHHPRAAGPG